METIHYELPRLTGTQSTGAAYLQGYLHPTNPEINQTDYPAIVIVPGGAFTHIPEHQAETLALAFFQQGYQAFFLRYHFLDEVSPLLPQPVIDLAQAIDILRINAGPWHLRADQIAAAGFSVGGQIVALLNNSWSHSWLTKAVGVDAKQLQLNAAILCYPVIRLDAGFPADPNARKQMAADYTKYAADELVNADCAPTFIWATRDDPLVPVENSLAYEQALAKAQIPFETHIFRHGSHGLALANKLTAWQPVANDPHVASWFPLCIDWLKDVL